MNYLSLDSDVFTGQKKQIKRYLVTSLQGYFPVLVKSGPNRLACIYRVGGVHVNIAATLAVSVSADGGKSWSDGTYVAPKWEDNRNPALGVTADGQLIAAYWKSKIDKYSETDNGLEWDKEKEPDGTTPSMYISIGSPSGESWTDMEPYRSDLLTFGSPYGRIISSPDGTLLMPAYGLRRSPVEGVRDTAIILRSTDGGRTWGDESLLGDKLNEFSLCYNASGTLIAASRAEKGGISTLSSDDDGRTWSEAERVTRPGEHPADITLLQSGNMLLTFGRRIRPFGCGALLSRDGGRTWDREHEVLLAGDGIRNYDLGYPSTVQLDDGSIITVLYYASGSQASEESFHGWGEISCQALSYSEDLFI
jgi:BNR repeat protein